VITTRERGGLTALFDPWVARKKERERERKNETSAAAAIATIEKRAGDFHETRSQARDKNHSASRHDKNP